MGRKAKIKQLRRESSSQHSSSQSQAETDPTKFVEHLEQQGYQLKKSDRCPDIPEKQNKPRL